jgi:hypothetical protein
MPKGSVTFDRNIISLGKKTLPKSNQAEKFVGLSPSITVWLARKVPEALRYDCRGK